MEYQFHIGLKNGEKFSFFEETSNKDAYIANMRNDMHSKWFTFITDEFIQYKISKSEIVSIGVSLNPEEVKELRK